MKYWLCFAWTCLFGQWEVARDQRCREPAYRTYTLHTGMVSLVKGPNIQSTLICVYGHIKNAEVGKVKYSATSLMREWDGVFTFFFYIRNVIYQYQCLSKTRNYQQNRISAKICIMMSFWHLQMCINGKLSQGSLHDIYLQCFHRKAVYLVHNKKFCVGA